MQITELRIRKVEGEGKLRAYVTVTFDSCFARDRSCLAFPSPCTSRVLYIAETPSIRLA